MNYKINFNEPIPQMIERLKQEHENFEISFEKMEKFVDDNEIKQAIETMHGMSESIIRHAVEEEARIMRVIMQKAKEESSSSIKIMQEHNWVVDFLKHKLQNIENEVQHHHQQQQQQEIKQINEFISNLRNHFLEEEQIVFPLALKADSN
jgi:hemerythrin-like domain-containing protein